MLAALIAFLLIRIFVLAVRCLGTPERALAISCSVWILQMGLSETVLLNPTLSSTPVLFITGRCASARSMWRKDGGGIVSPLVGGKSAVVCPVPGDHSVHWRDDSRVHAPADKVQLRGVGVSRLATTAKFSGASPSGLNRRSIGPRIKPAGLCSFHVNEL